MIAKLTAKERGEEWAPMVECICASGSIRAPVEVRPITTPVSATPFTDASSPVDFNAIHHATIALNSELDSDKSFSTPAKKYIKCLGRALERHHASSSILQQDGNQ